MPTPQTSMDRPGASSDAGSRNFSDYDEPRGRFADRTKRLARRQESDVFRRYLMPITWILGLAGFLGLFAVWIAGGTDAMTHSPVWPVFAPLFAAPVLTAFVRLVRGHFHPAVREL
jgi:hypothetical protein